MSIKLIKYFTSFNSYSEPETPGSLIWGSDRDVPRNVWCNTHFYGAFIEIFRPISTEACIHDPFLRHGQLPWSSAWSVTMIVGMVSYHDRRHGQLPWSSAWSVTMIVGMVSYHDRRHGQLPWSSAWSVTMIVGMVSYHDRRHGQLPWSSAWSVTMIVGMASYHDRRHGQLPWSSAWSVTMIVGMVSYHDRRHGQLPWSSAWSVTMIVGMVSYHDRRHGQLPWSSAWSVTMIVGMVSYHDRFRLSIYETGETHYNILVVRGKTHMDDFKKNFCLHMHTLQRNSKSKGLTPVEITCRWRLCSTNLKRKCIFSCWHF